MSVQTLAAIEAAIIAHHRDTADSENVERATALVTRWVIGYEIANVVDVGEAEGGHVMGYANSYVMSDSSPNTLAHLAYWTGDVIDSEINRGGE
ncbi:hypothetical protein [Microbacterium sp. VKM Ac-2923]|uniref:hypothetical protein n=1 Tax=Microbacterium sp. VKM Ac-2923 TaxID=2929476 RepID=UPI001FB216FE|nr:hypothetical protein [Microbacterium sp. VKM Ac-2923]MCJ1709243.1 hypothetical protein [Microbacterium sp. VKM Ac-2923]